MLVSNHRAASCTPIPTAPTRLNFSHRTTDRHTAHSLTEVSPLDKAEQCEFRLRRPPLPACPRSQSRRPDRRGETCDRRRVRTVEKSKRHCRSSGESESPSVRTERMTCGTCRSCTWSDKTQPIAPKIRRAYRWQSASAEILREPNLTSGTLRRKCRSCDRHKIRTGGAAGSDNGRVSHRDCRPASSPQ